MGQDPDDESRYNYRNFIELERGKSTDNESSFDAVKGVRGCKSFDGCKVTLNEVSASLQ